MVSRREYLEKKLGDCEGTLRDARASRQQNKREVKVNQAVMQMKAKIEGRAVCGRGEGVRGCWDQIRAVPSGAHLFLLVWAMSLDSQLPGE